MTIIKADFSQEKKTSARKKKEEKPIPEYQLHVSLAFSEPLIWRRITVPGEITLAQLHEVLQVCMGWRGSHNHQFYVGKVFYNSDTENGEQRFNEAATSLHALEEAMKWCFTYMYDAGDGWEHTIELERTLPSTPEKKYPRLLDGEWNTPPEDIGSVHVYTELVYALENPESPKNKALLQESGLERFELDRFDPEEINAELRERVGSL